MQFLVIWSKKETAFDTVSPEYSAEEILKYIIFNENYRILIKISLKFCFLRVKLITSQHWLR